MKGIRRTVAFGLVLGVIGGLLMAGTAQAQDESTSTDVQTFNIGIGSDITSLNPFRLCCGADYEYLELIYNLGITYGQEDLSAAPQLVTSWTPNDDFTQYTLKIQTGATWTDGQPVTAQDVAFTYGFIVDNAMAYYKDYFAFDPTFKATDDETVIWTAQKPTFAPDIPAYAPILPEHIWSQYVITDADYPCGEGYAGKFTQEQCNAQATRQAARDFENDPPIGSGPFMLDEWKRGQFIKFTKNPTYWGGQPAAIDEIVFRVYQNKEAMATALGTGEIDFAEDLSPTLFNSLKGNPDVTTHVADAGCWGNLAYNFGGQSPKSTNHPALKDIKVRQAIAYAVNKQEIVDKVYQGTATVGQSILQPTKNGKWVTDIPEQYQYNFNPAKANQILDDAGYIDTDNDGIREMPDGTDPLNFEFMVITDVNGSVDTGKFLQSYLADIGIGVSFITVDEKKAGDLWYTGEWDAYVWDWCPDPDPDFMLSVFTTSQCGGWSDGCFSDPRMDKLYELQRGELDPAKRKEYVDEAQVLVAKEQPLIVIANWSDLQAYRSDRWTGFHPVPNADTGLLLFGYGTIQTYMELTPVAGAGQSGSSGLPAWVWIAIVGGIVVIGGIVIMVRRGKESEEA
jgi:peptide/nickel transport system substrate-binding protein